MCEGFRSVTGMDDGDKVDRVIVATDIGAESQVQASVIDNLGVRIKDPSDLYVHKTNYGLNAYRQLLQQTDRDFSLSACRHDRRRREIPLRPETRRHRGILRRRPENYCPRRQSYALSFAVDSSAAADQNAAARNVVAAVSVETAVAVVQNAAVAVNAVDTAAVVATAVADYIAPDCEFDSGQTARPAWRFDLPTIADSVRQSRPD